MKLDLEHEDICKAVSYYLSKTKGFQVDCDPKHFTFKTSEDAQLEVAIKGGDMNVPAPDWILKLDAASGATRLSKPAGPEPPKAAEPVPVPAPAPALRKAPAKPSTPVKHPQNSMWYAVPPGSTKIPTPKLRNLDEGIPSEHEEEPQYVDDDGRANTPVAESRLAIDTTPLSEDEQAAMNEILRRSRATTDAGPVRGLASIGEPDAVGEVVE